ncbi:hypothetical protein EDB81DRAFT_717036 [Dactylonectria macrodidyma]|uniref:Uncharacterized protein n=1 Tax=Dactylonectria macrodidyma TaxID=307937 RepID=A0A9P9F8F9_9HYPO|nr:hypothetical protein EDB81DRAFT_717036 [Dactylonectria macrodidyma]
MLSASGPARTPRVLFISVVAAVILLLALFSFSESFSSRAVDYAHKAKEYWKQASSTSVYNCEDPYRRPGYLYIDPEDYKNTRWIPYTDDFLDADVPSYAEYPRLDGGDLFFNRTAVDADVLDSTSNPRQWMQLAVAEDQRRLAAVTVEKGKQKAEDFVDMKDDGDLGWLWGRRVLIFGDSVDRFMMQFFCEEFGRPLRQPAPHTTATCSIPTLNLTFTHWHHAGSWTNRPEWWWMKDMKEIPFEERWDKFWAPTLDKTVRGPTGQPDLLLWQSGLWEQRAMWESAEAHHDADHPMAQRERQLVWQEIRFVAARMKKFIQRVDEEFPGVPTMFRTLTIHRNSNATDANIYELDRISRALAEQAGHEVFEWGRILTAFSMLYKDKTHTGKGPGSWLWGNMVLEYLARSAGIQDEARSPYFDGWDACHSHLATWGGR